MSMSLTLKGLEKAGVKTVGLCEEIASDGKLIAPDLNIRFTHRGKYGTFAYVDNIYECLKKRRMWTFTISTAHGCITDLQFPDMLIKQEEHT